MRRLRLPTAWAVTTVVLSALWLVQLARADDRVDARREFRSGMRAISEGRYDEGLEHLERAYQILPHPNVLYNIALAHLQAGHDVDALHYLERYRETAPLDIAQVDALIAQLQAPVTLPPRDPAPEPETEPAPAPEGEEPAQAAEPEPVAPPARIAPPRAVPPPSPTEDTTYDERVTSASRLSQSPLDAPNATAVITAQDIRMSGITQLSQLLRLVAGVEVTTVAPYHAEVSIRGLNRRSSNKVLLLLDGHPMRKDFMGTNWIDMVPLLVEDIERVEIIRGPASALYGADAFSGVINVITRAPGEGGPYVVAKAGSGDTYQAGASFSGKAAPSVSYRGSAFYAQADDFARVVGPRRVDVRLPNGEPERGFNAVAANTDVAWKYAKNGTASVGGNYATGDFTIQGLSRLGQVVISRAYETQAYGLVTTPFGLRVSTTYDRVVGHPLPSYITPGSPYEARSYTRQELFDLDVSWSGNFHLLVPHTLTAGAGYRFKYIDWTWLDGTHTQHHEGAYVQDVMQLTEALRLQVGARIDHHPLLDSLQFSPRGSLVYRFLGEQSVRLSAGRAFRGPSFLESYLQQKNETQVNGVVGIGKGNDKLDPESITSLELGYQNQQFDFFTLELNAYYNWIRDAILFTDVDRFTLGDFNGGNSLAAYDPTVQAYPVGTLSFANERATYRQIGGELGVRAYPLEGLDVFANYAIHQTRPTDARKVDPARADEQQTSLHKVNAGVRWRSASGLELGSDLSWVSPQRWAEQVTDVDLGVRWQSFRVESFTMLNARIGYRLFSDRLVLSFGAYNLAFQDRRQHPFAQPIATRFYGTAKVSF